jgi:hypothetical protein
MAADFTMKPTTDTANRARRGFPILLACCFTGFAHLGILRGEDVPQSPEDISSEVDGAATAGQGRMLPTFDRWAEARRNIREKTGFGWTAGFANVAHAVAGGDGVPFGASGDLSAQGIWSPGLRGTDLPTEFRFRARSRQAYGATAPSEIAAEIGALWGVVDGFSDRGFEMPDCFVRHEFKRSGVELRYGQMSIDSQFGGHTFASSKKYFLNQAFSSNPAVAFPRFGAGLTLAKEFGNGFSVGAGTTTVQGTQNGSQVDVRMGSGDLFKALEIGYQYRGDDLLERNIALLGWHSDALADGAQAEGEGLQLTHARTLDDDGTRLFSTLAWSTGGAAALEGIATCGIGFPVGDHDFAGLAGGIGIGSGPDAPVQGVIEGFYRWQPRADLQISPDFQLLFGEGLRGDPGVRVLTGLRLVLGF